MITNSNRYNEYKIYFEKTQFKFNEKIVLNILHISFNQDSILHSTHFIKNHLLIFDEEGSIYELKNNLAVSGGPGYRYILGSMQSYNFTITLNSFSRFSRNSYTFNPILKKGEYYIYFGFLEGEFPYDYDFDSVFDLISEVSEENYIKITIY